jgi:hypothetical protein
LGDPRRVPASRRVSCDMDIGALQAEILGLLADAHARVEAAFLWHVGEPGVEVDESEDRAHGRRLAGADGAEDADDAAGGDREGEMVESDEVAVAAYQAIELGAVRPSFGVIRPSRG